MYTWGKEVLFSHDICKVISYDDYHNEIVMLTETANEDLRPDMKILYPDAKHMHDLAIITMTLNGKIEKVYNINYGSANIYMYIGSHSGFINND